ncbi:CLOCK-interacting pacemaker isoform 2-T5 [Anomaloglossus baeobatrachus]
MEKLEAGSPRQKRTPLTPGLRSTVPAASPGLQSTLPAASPGLRSTVPAASPGLRSTVPAASPGLRSTVPAASPGLRSTVPAASPGLRSTVPAASPGLRSTVPAASPGLRSTVPAASPGLRSTVPAASPGLRSTVPAASPGLRSTVPAASPGLRSTVPAASPGLRSTVPAASPGLRSTVPAASESDKDSGFSDAASECLSCVEQTDAEDGAPSSHCSPPCPPSHHSPLLVLQNLIDQGSRPEPHMQSWAVRPSFQLLPPSSQILVFPPSIYSTKPQTICKNSTKYLPILNSYTKIAPHPSQLSSSVTYPNTNKRGANPAHHSQAKRLSSGLQHCTAKGKATSAVPETHEQKLVMPSDDVSYCERDLTTPPKDTDDTLTTERGDPRTVSSPSISHSEDGTLPAQQPQDKSRRFQNTLDVLRRSGLLSIAMKTKELARLNQATQVQLERLQEQVAIYSKAICSNNPDDWQMVHDSLAASHVIVREIDM